jgi:chromosome segregation ATPase
MVEVLVSDERLRHLVFQARRHENAAQWAVLRHNPGPWERVVESLDSRLPQLEQEIQAARSEIERLTDRKLELERELLSCPVEEIAGKRAALTALHLQLDEQSRRLKEARNGCLAEVAGRGR